MPKEEGPAVNEPRRTRWVAIAAVMAAVIVLFPWMSPASGGDRSEMGESLALAAAGSCPPATDDGPVLKTDEAWLPRWGGGGVGVCEGGPGPC